MPVTFWILPVIFLVIAFIYSSVGFGGGSSYLAVLAMYSLPFQEMKLTALVCNIIVVTGGTIIFIRNGQLPLRRVVPLVSASIVMAYLGARLKISEEVFFLILGVCLIVAGLLLWIRPVPSSNLSGKSSRNSLAEIVPGAGIGFVSGMVGIGGGIFLSPVLNLMRWDTPKRIAATASFFILVNSISGLAGQLSSPVVNVNYQRIAILAIAVFAGGQLGSRIGAVKFSQLIVRRVTAALVTVAGVEVLFKHVPHLL